MKVVGLVGQSGTGKTMIAKHLVARGAGHIDADQIAHQVLGTNDEVREGIRERFGDKMFVDGHIDRRALGRMVFADVEALQALNRIVHPAIIDECVARLNQLEKAGLDLVVIDAALLLEVAIPVKIDLMIALRCGRKEQLRRLVAQGERSQEEIAARLDTQSRIEESFDRADVILNTARTKTEVLDEIDRTIKVLLDHPNG